MDLVFGQTWRRDEALLCLCGDAETLGSPSFSNVRRVFTDSADLLGQARRRGEPLRCVRGETEEPSSPELSRVSSAGRPEKDELFVVFWLSPRQGRIDRCLLASVLTRTAVMLSTRGQTVLEAEILSSASASTSCPRPHPCPQASILGMSSDFVTWPRTYVYFTTKPKPMICIRQYVPCHPSRNLLFTAT